jgi:DHA3 family multidrug efflux protein-like MFS transporter
MKPFYTILGNSLAASVVNNFVWFAVTFWVFLETQSVVATSIMAGVFTITIALSGIFLGSLVDRYPKKTTMMASSLASAVLYALAAVVYVSSPAGALADPASPASPSRRS